MRLVYTSVILLNLVGLHNAYAAAPMVDELSNDVAAYCKFVEERNTAQRDLLNAPNVIVRVQNANYDYPYQNNVISALSKNLSDFGKAKHLKQLIQDECLYYRLSQEAKLQIQYAIPNIQRQALILKLRHLQQAKSKLKGLLNVIRQRMDKKNDTLATYYKLDAVVQRLEDAERDIAINLAVQPPRKINHVRIKNLFNQVVAADKKRQATRAKLAKQDNWSLELQVGGQENFSPHLNQNVQPYGAVFWRYNLGSLLSNKKRDNSVSQYAEWKHKQVNGIQKQLVRLVYSMNELQAAEKERLQYLKRSHRKYEGVSKKMAAIDSLKAAHFKQQIEVDRIMMEVEMQYAQDRIDLLKKAKD